MNILCATDYPVVQQAAQLANNLLANAAFYDGIAQYPSFDLSTATPAQVADILRKSPLTFTVELFYPGLFGRLTRYRNTLAYTDSNYPNTLFLNSRKLKRPAQEIAATIMHEAVHAADDAEPTYTFGHGNNSPIGKENTAPYWIGNYAYRLLHPAGSGASLALAFDQEEES